MCSCVFLCAFVHSYTYESTSEHFLIYSLLRTLQCRRMCKRYVELFVRKKQCHISEEEERECEGLERDLGFDLQLICRKMGLKFLQKDRIYQEEQKRCVFCSLPISLPSLSPLSLSLSHIFSLSLSYSLSLSPLNFRRKRAAEKPPQPQSWSNWALSWVVTTTPTEDNVPNLEMSPEIWKELQDSFHSESAESGSLSKAENSIDPKEYVTHSLSVLIEEFRLKLLKPNVDYPKKGFLLVFFSFLSLSLSFFLLSPLSPSLSSSLPPSLPPLLSLRE